MGNVDATEVAKFDGLASHWWDSSGPLKALHQINPLRLRYIRRAGISEGSGSPGCGLRRRNPFRSHGRGRRPGYGHRSGGRGPFRGPPSRGHEAGLKIDYHQEAVESLASSADHLYDLVTCMELLEHVPDPRSVVRACSRLLKPDGDLIFATINRNPKSFLFAIVGAEYLLRLLPMGSHRHARFIKPHELIGWGKECRLKIQDTTGLGYNPFTHGYFLTRDTSVNYLAHFKSNTRQQGIGNGHK